MSWRLQAAGALLLALDLGAQQPPTVTITFLANEGVKIAAGDRAVLIDGLFRYYGDDFALPHDSTQRALEAASTPFLRSHMGHLGGGTILLPSLSLERKLCLSLERISLPPAR